MQLNIIPPTDPTRLRAIQQDLERNGIQPTILVGSQYTTPYFLGHLIRLAASGARAILADHCTPLQISSAIEASNSQQWQALPDDLEIHLVRQS